MSVRLWFALGALALAAVAAVAMAFGPALFGRAKPTVAGRKEPPVKPDVKNKSAAPRTPLPDVIPSLHILVRKSARELILYSGGKEVRRYACIIGGNPVGNKEREGDRRTPEGDYYVCVKNPQSKYHLSLGLSYPNADDAERGLRLKIITRAQRNEIMEAIHDGRRPPWNTPMGGEIYIHGRGSGRDATLGCVALANEDIEEIYRVTPASTPVKIVP